jgi:hypothetical protein
MLKVHTNLDFENAREALRRVIAESSHATGYVEGDTFRLNPKPARRGVPVTLYGRIEPDRDGTLVSVWPFPHWAMIFWFPVWTWFCLQLVHAPVWFITLGFIAGIISFVVETRRGYDLLRRTYLV